MEENKFCTEKTCTPVTSASETRVYQHLYLRGNYQQDMFFDKIDMINTWNRLWLSAEAVDAQILSFIILNNHFHLIVIFQNDEQRTRFKHHFRLSITQYHNRRYKIRGTLGTRSLQHALLKNEDDIKDCICYHIRNVLHHGITSNYLDYPYSTARAVFSLASAKQQGFYTRETLPDNLARAYLPASKELPKGWMMTIEGLIVPPKNIFRADLLEAFFNNSSETYLDALTHRTIREAEDNGPNDGLLTGKTCTPTHSASETRVCNSRTDDTSASETRSERITDETVVEYVKEMCQVPIPAMNNEQKMIAIKLIIKQYPQVSIRLLSRLFAIPNSTLKFRLKIFHKHK